MANPSDRYTQPLATKTLPNGKTVYASALPAPVTVDPLNDILLKASEHDRMDIIAYNAYGGQQYWWRIAAANGLVNGSVFIPAGVQFFVPLAKTTG